MPPADIWLPASWSDVVGGTPVVLRVLLLMALANLLVFRGLKRGEKTASAPRVSVLVPARNEARNIEDCVSSLFAQEYPNFELLVLDDNSTDGTGDLVRRLIESAGADGKARVLNGAPLEHGWCGKNWACDQLAREARGDFLLFVDADTVHEPGMIAAAVEMARRTRADLVTAWPRQVTKTLGEKLIIPIIYLIGFVFCAHWLVAVLQRFPQLAKAVGARFTRALGSANGQFLFFTRDSYFKIGGHAAVRDSVVEDVALGREVTARMGQGMRLCVCDAFRFSRVRMYRSFGETWDGFSKNLRAVFGRKRVLFWLFLLGLLTCLLLPSIRWLWREHAWKQAVLVLVLRALITVRCRTSWISVVLHPVSIVLVVAIALRSWWLSRGNGVEWKGRTYQVRT